MELLIFNVQEFLTHIVLASEHLPSIRMMFDDIEDMIFEKAIHWSPHGENASYSHSDLMLHKKLWDVMSCDKGGAPKDHGFVDWCRRIAWHYKQRFVDWCRSIEANNDATEHDNPYRKLVEDIWEHELTPAQKMKPKYKLREDASISQELRSLVQVILRKNLGDARVATYMLQHGVPTLLDPPWFRSTPPQTEIDNILEEFLGWYASLLKWLSNLQNDPNTIVAQKLSDLNQKEWQAERRRRKSNIEQQLRQGELLANLRDTHVKHFHDMSATEQRVLEEYDTGKMQKRHDNVRIRKPK